MIDKIFDTLVKSLDVLNITDTNSKIISFIRVKLTNILRKILKTNHLSNNKINDLLSSIKITKDSDIRFTCSKELCKEIENAVLAECKEKISNFINGKQEVQFIPHSKNKVLYVTLDVRTEYSSKELRDKLNELNKKWFYNSIYYKYNMLDLLLDDSFYYERYFNKLKWQYKMFNDLLKTIDKDKLEIILFYIDLESLIEVGETITDLSYKANKKSVLIKNFSKFNIDKSFILTDKKLELAKNVVEKLRDKPLEELQAYSRENDGYKIASEKMFGKEINLYIAMQQIMKYDPWIDEPLTEEEKERFLASKL